MIREITIGLSEEELGALACDEALEFQIKAKGQRIKIYIVAASTMEGSKFQTS